MSQNSDSQPSVTTPISPVAITTLFDMEIPFRSSYQLKAYQFVSSSPEQSHPKIVLVSGLHGNEVTPIYAVNQLQKIIQRYSLQQGSVDIIPVVNTLGLDQTMKRFPLDYKDINKIFPGDPEGSVSYRIAHVVQDFCAPHDWVICLHSGGAHVRDIPQVRMVREQEDVSRCFSLPFIWKRQGIGGTASLLDICNTRKQNVLYFSAGRGETLDLSLASHVVKALVEFLVHLHMLPTECLQEFSSVSSYGNSICVEDEHISECRSQHSGFFISEKNIGDIVQSGDILGYIENVIGGERVETILAPWNALVVGIRCNPIVYPQELLLKLAQIP